MSFIINFYEFIIVFDYCAIYLRKINKIYFDIEKDNFIESYYN
jgi:hypothetical protein